MANASREPERIFGRRLREERERRGLGQADLAALVTQAGVTLIGSAVSKTESGRRLVRLNEAVAVAAVLGIPLAAMITDTTDTEREIARLRAEADRLAGESDDALRRAVQYRNQAAELAGEYQ